MDLCHLTQYTKTILKYCLEELPAGEFVPFMFLYCCLMSLLVLSHPKHKPSNKAYAVQYRELYIGEAA